jgi:hypothetical protein
MKKIITVLIAIVSFVAVRAQSTKDEARKVILGKEKKPTITQQQGRTVILGRNGQTTTVYKKNPNGVHRYGKTNNPGKHLGWYKGVGNPHRTGVVPGKKRKG